MQIVDPDVSRRKFTRAIRSFRANEKLHVARGIWLMDATFPTATVGFVAVNCTPPVLVVAVRFDFTDHDVRPLSVRFVNPFDGNILTKDQLQTKMPRINSGLPAEVAAAMQMGAIPAQVTEMIQGYSGQPAFLCLPGIREYHDHPAHSGDHWEARRASGEGSMFEIIDKIWQYGSAPVNSFMPQIQLILGQSGVSQ